jgi:hypothetical protein
MQSTPQQWLFIAVLIVMLGSTVGLLVWGAILEIRFISPLTLIKTDNKEKWRRAAILALIQTSMLPIFGTAMLIIYTPAGKLLMFLICNGLWVVVFPLVILFKRWEFERHIKNDLRLDKMMKDKSNNYRGLFSSPLTNWISIFMTAEQKRFFSEGFPDDVEQKKDDES